MNINLIRDRKNQVLGNKSSMRMQRFFFVLVLFCLSNANVIAKSSINPFEKAIDINISDDVDWVVKDKTATRSASDGGEYYHLNFDKSNLRLRITEDKLDAASTAVVYDQLKIEDVLIDGERLPAFQWCLNHQEKHSRFLQQGLSVDKNVCSNLGQTGTFKMRLNAASLDSIKSGTLLTFKIRPFRSVVNVNFAISDFSAMYAKLFTPVVVKKIVPVAIPKVQKPVKVVKQAPAKTCIAYPPKGYSTIKAVKYSCGDTSAKAQADKGIAAKVKVERDRRKAVAAERERKQRAAEAKKKKLAEAEKANAAKLAAEQAAIAASTVKQEAILSEISQKMVNLCQKKWAIGEHRCYCEKYIEHAPEGIVSDSSCK